MSSCVINLLLCFSVPRYIYSTRISKKSSLSPNYNWVMWWETLGNVLTFTLSAVDEIAWKSDGNLFDVWATKLWILWSINIYTVGLCVCVCFKSHVVRPYIAPKFKIFHRSTFIKNKYIPTILLACAVNPGEIKNAFLWRCKMLNSASHLTLLDLAVALNPYIPAHAAVFTVSICRTKRTCSIFNKLALSLTSCDIWCNLRDCRLQHSGVTQPWLNNSVCAMHITLCPGFPLGP